MTSQVDVFAMARVAARAAKLRYRWADLRDLEQEAALAMLLALPHHDATRGPLEPFLMYRAWDRLSRWAWEFVGPVRQRSDRNVGWAPGAALPERLAATAPNPEEALRRARLGRALERVLARHGVAAQLVITREAPLHQIAEDAGQDRVELAREVRAGREMLRQLAEDHL